MAWVEVRGGCRVVGYYIYRSGVYIVEGKNHTRKINFMNELTLFTTILLKSNKYDHYRHYFTVTT